MDSDEDRKRRKQPRYNCVSRILYTTVRSESAEHEREGTMLNMSSAGLCLSVEERLKIGQEISVTQCVASFCCRKYTVQWIRPENKEHEAYIAGLMSPEYKLYY
jgi:hypothetical protein